MKYLNLDLEKLKMACVDTGSKHEKLSALLFFSNSLNVEIGRICLLDTLNDKCVKEFPYVMFNGKYITSASMPPPGKNSFTSLNELITGCQSKRFYHGGQVNDLGNGSHSITYDADEQVISIGYTRFPVTIVKQLTELVNRDKDNSGNLIIY